MLDSESFKCNFFVTLATLAACAAKNKKQEKNEKRAINKPQQQQTFVSVA